MIDKKEAISKIIAAKYIWIYGAGEVGKRAVAGMRDSSLYSRVMGVVVSKSGENEKIEGYRVIDISSVTTAHEDTFFLIAVSEKYHEGIINTLERYGYHDYDVWEPSIALYASDHTFISRRKGLSKLCMVLSGYKSFLWDNVFERLDRFIPDDVEVCIMSSGLYDERLDHIAEEKGYSYLSTSLNDLTLVQNMALSIYDDVEWVYKMDEDMFLTEGCFEKLMRTYHKVELEEHYSIGFTAPLIPLNGYSFIHVLNHYGKLDKYERRFGSALYGGHKERAIECDADTAGFIWGSEGGLPQLDDMNREFTEKWAYSVCGVRFSIGFILFRREFWELLGGFNMHGEADLGVDELQICANCATRSRAMIVSHDTVVGHFAFGSQTESMKAYYHEHPEVFEIREK